MTLVVRWIVTVCDYEGNQRDIYVDVDGKWSDNAVIERYATLPIPAGRSKLIVYREGTLDIAPGLCYT